MFIEKIDFKLLRKQKKTLITLSFNTLIHPTKRKDIDGIINLLDELQDYAEDVLKINGVFK
jgi:uncharacterized protein Yka (UPF0111/DUF47 family)